MKRWSTITIFFAQIFLFGCATSYLGYDFRMINPTDSAKMAYSDQDINVSFIPSKTSYMGVEGAQQYENFDGISFVLENRTTEVLTIDWNKISFTDCYGSSGNSVMHKGIKYEDCASAKSPTTIPPKGKLSDIIVPCYALSPSVGGYGTRWEVHVLPSPRKLPEVEFGISMPVQIGKRVRNYDFQFRATKIQKEW